MKTGDRIEITDELAEGAKRWSPDSTQIALTLPMPGDTQLAGTYIKNLETGTLIGVQDSDQYNYEFASNPTWSPDGNKIAYIGDYYDVEGKRHPRTLFIHDIKSGKQTPLVDEVQSWSRIIWSPDTQNRLCVIKRKAL